MNNLMNLVYLAGLREGYEWDEILINKLTIPYYNPLGKDESSEDVSKKSKFILYIITPDFEVGDFATITNLSNRQDDSLLVLVNCYDKNHDLESPRPMTEKEKSLNRSINLSLEYLHTVSSNKVAVCDSINNAIEYLLCSYTQLVLNEKYLKTDNGRKAEIDYAKELKMLAQNYNIPVITAMQTNRIEETSPISYENDKIKGSKPLKIFLSHPMSGLSEDEIMNIRYKAYHYIASKINENIEIIDNYHHKDIPENAGRLWHLGTSIRQMEEADAIYFCDGWEKSEGCNIERKICALYHLRVIK